MKVSVGKLEENLKLKVDKMNLDEFGKNIDKRLHSEVSKKIDKQDLRKNNNIMIKKVT